MLFIFISNVITNTIESNQIESTIDADKLQ